MAVVSVCRQFPNCGYRMMQAHLQSMALVIQRQRVRDALPRVDPIGAGVQLFLDEPTKWLAIMHYGTLIATFPWLGGDLWYKEELMAIAAS